MTKDPLIIDSTLLSSIADGDEKSFLSLFSVYSPQIRSFARKVTFSDEDAEEIIQETFLRVWLYRDKLPELLNIQSWIFTVAANECMRFMRKKINYEKRLEKSANSTAINPIPTPLDYVQAGEVSEIIYNTVNAMPPRKKAIYQLSRDNGLKPAAIAEKLSLSVGTVKNVLSQSLAEIRTALLEKGISLGIILYHYFFLF